MLFIHNRKLKIEKFVQIFNEFDVWKMKISITTSSANRRRDPQKALTKKR